MLVEAPLGRRSGETQLELRIGVKRSGDCVLRDAGKLRVGGRALELYAGRTLDLCG